jgi:hypothetical protein
MVMSTLGQDVVMWTEVWKMVGLVGPVGGAMLLLAYCIILVWKYAARPFLAEIRPISENLAQAAKSNEQTAMTNVTVANCNKDTAITWQKSIETASAWQKSMEAAMAIAREHAKP